jgi:hypothetical protein
MSHQPTRKAQSMFSKPYMLPTLTISSKAFPREYACTGTSVATNVTSAITIKIVILARWFVKGFFLLFLTQNHDKSIIDHFSIMRAALQYHVTLSMSLYR